MSDPEKILVVDFALLGDLVLGLKVNQAIQKQLPNAKTWWMVNEAYCELVAAQPEVEGVFGVAKYKSRLKSLLGGMAFSRKAKPDLSLLMHDSFFSALMARPGGGRRVGFNREGRGFLLSKALPMPGKIHLLKRREVILAEALNLSLDEQGPWVFVHQTWKQEVAHLGESPFFLINVNASWPSKCFPLERFKEVARSLKNLYPDLTCFAIGTKEELPKIQELQKDCPWVMDAGRLTIGGLAALCQKAKLLLSNDSGPMHLAQSVGCPVVGLFGPTDPGHCGPVGERHTVLEAEVPCRPCYQYDCPNVTEGPGPGWMQCMEDISQEKIVQACSEFLD